MSKHLGERLVDYAWDMLTPQEQTQAEAHLRECAECRDQLAQYQALTGQLARAVPAMLKHVPPRVKSGWADVAERVPQLRGRPLRPSKRHSLPGFVTAGLALSTALVILLAVTTQAWLIHPSFTATAPYPTQFGTPVASATFTPERPTAAATPVSYLAPMPAPRPAAIITTVRP
jgi:hypothetical protein